MIRTRRNLAMKERWPAESLRHRGTRAVCLPSLISLLALAGCLPQPPAPTIANVRISAAGDVNATPEGQGAPVVIRIYQLASKSAFEGAEFRRLYNADTTTLGGDLIKKDELLLIPGTSKSITLMPSEAVHALGVFAGYRDFQNATWRADSDLPAHQTTAVTVTAERDRIKLAAAPGKPGGQ
jgi:type VI secretion system protein VasD